MTKNLLQLRNGSKGYGNKTLFENASFVINEDEHVGVIGPNGAGKTTLMRIITGSEELDSGELVLNSGVRIGYLAQHDKAESPLTVAEFLEQDCYLPLWELHKLSHGLGLTDEDFQKPIKSLSGGYRMRVKLLRLLGQQPNLMLLDEPTNYLDLETLLVLENFLQSYQGAFMLISHDREFLRRTTNHILEVETGDIIKFPGNIDDYFEQKAMLREQLEKRAMSLAAKRQEVLDFAARFGAKASKASQAQSRLKSLDRMERIEVKSLPVTATIRIPDPVPTGKLSLRLRGADIGYDERVVLKNITTEILNGDHIGVVGFNGAGKSTLLKTLAGALPLRGGTRETGYEVKIGYYAQHVGDSLDPTSTVFESLQRDAHPSILEQAIRDLAGSLLFSGNDIHKKVGSLSGGEKARVALGRILLQRVPCLLLDEPTNHLDFYTVEALTQALAKYPGTLIVVSHDQGFISRITTKIMEVRNGAVENYPGTYDEYVWSLQRGILATREQEQAKPAKKSAPAKTTPSEKPKTPVAPRKTLEARARQITRDIADIEKKMQRNQHRLEELVVLQSTTQGGFNPHAHQEMAAVQAAVDEAEAAWLAALEEQEKIKNDLAALDH